MKNNPKLKNKNKFKKFLAASSALAVIMGSSATMAGVLSAQQYDRSGNMPDAIISDNLQSDVANDPGASQPQASWVSQNSFIRSHGKPISVVGNAKIALIDPNSYGYDGGNPVPINAKVTIQPDANAELGAVFDSNASPGRIDVFVKGGSTLTLKDVGKQGNPNTGDPVLAGDFSALQDLILGDNTSTDPTKLIIEGGGDLSSTTIPVRVYRDNLATNKVFVEVNNNNNDTQLDVTFDKNIGTDGQTDKGHHVRNFDIDGNTKVTFKGSRVNIGEDNQVKNTLVGDAIRIKNAQARVVLDSSVNPIEVTSSIKSISGAAAGTLEFKTSNGNEIRFRREIGESETTGMKNIEISGSGDVKIASSKIHGAINFTADADENSTLIFESLDHIDFAKAEIYSVDNMTAVDAGKLYFHYPGDANLISHEIGKTRPIKEIILDPNVNLYITHASDFLHRVDLLRASASTSKFRLGPNVKLESNFQGALNGGGQLEFNGHGTFKGQLGDVNKYLTSVDQREEGKATIEVSSGATVHVDKFNMHKENADFLFLGTGYIIGSDNAPGAIDNLATSGNAIIFKGTAGNIFVNGPVGETKPFQKLLLDGEAGHLVHFKHGTFNVGKIEIKKSTFEFSNSLTGVTNIKFDDEGSGGLLWLTPNNINISYDGAFDLGTNPNGRGEIHVANTISDKNVTIGDNIGNVDEPSNALFKMYTKATDGGSRVDIKGSAHIKTLQTDGGLFTLNADKKYRFDNFINNGPNVGGFDIKGSAELMGPNTGNLDLGTEIQPMKRLNFYPASTLVVNSGINLFLEDITAANHGDGSLVFKGTHRFSNTNQSKELKDMTLEENADVTIDKDLTFTGTTDIGNNATLRVLGNYTSKTAITGNKLSLENTTKIDVTGPAGNVNTLDIHGSDVEFKTPDAYTGTFDFKEDSTGNLRFADGSNIGEANFINNSGSERKISLPKTTNFTGNLVSGKDENQLNIEVSDGKNATIASDANVGKIKFTTPESNKGDVIIDKSGLDIRGVGASGKLIGKLDIKESTTISEGTYANKIEVESGTNTNFKATVQSDDFQLKGDAIVNFENNINLQASVKGANNGNGTMNFAGGTVGNDIGTSSKGLATVNFSDVESETLKLDNKAVYATNNINLRKGKIELANNDVELCGMVNMTDANLDLGAKKLILHKKDTLLNISGENNIRVKVNSDLTAGQMVVEGTIKVADGTKVNFEIDNRAFLSTGKYKILILDGTTGDSLSEKNFTATSMNNLLTPKLHMEGVDLFITSQFNDNGLRDRLDDVPTSEIDSLIKILNGESGQALEFKELFGSLIDPTTGELNATVSADATERLLNQNNEDNQTVITNANRATNDAIGTRLGNLVVPTPGASGVSSGDDQTKFGVWFSPFFGVANQKAINGTGAYKSDVAGGTFGFDTKTNDDLIIGAAVTLAASNVKYKDKKSGDKTKINSTMFSVYAMQNITDNWYASGTATLGTNQLKSNEKRVSGLTTHDTVTAKYNSMSFSGTAMIGYNYAAPEFVVTPSAGLRYIRVNNTGYKEAGSTTGQNLDVASKASNKIEAIAGLRVAARPIDMSGIMVTPEIHTSASYEILNQKTSQKVQLSGAGDIGKGATKSIRARYNVGFGVMAEYGNMDYGIGYDLTLAKKYVGHQGSLTLRLNF